MGSDQSAGDIAFDAAGNAFVSTLSGALYRVSANLSTVQSIGNLPNGDFLGLTFAPQTTFLGFRTGGEVYQINPANAAATLVSTLNHPNLSGILGAATLSVPLTTTAGSGIGIRVENNAGPTLMNNIVANFETGIEVDASSEPNTVIASTLYHNNATHSNVGLGTNFPVVVDPADPVFVNVATSNFNLVPGVAAIDSSIDSIQERPPLRNVKASIGIPPSNVLAPERDSLGQLRRDDPSFQPPFGAGQVVFKDRGALDRVDFTGPSATLISPQDNDAAGFDQNPADFDVRTSGQVVSEFVIKLLDGREPIDPDEGTGIDESTIAAGAVMIEYFLPSDVTFSTPEVLQLGADYKFRYNPVDKTIILTDVGGLFPPGFYRILLDNTPINTMDPDDDGVDAIRDLSGNPLKPNRSANSTLFEAGQTGFFIEIPDNLDFGDAPDSYRTVIQPGVDPSLDGPRHTLRQNFFLGTTVDAELDGQPTDAADGDGADEDGVRIRGQLLQGQIINVGATIALEVFASASGFLNAWIDFNRNGVFDEEIDLDGDGVIDGSEHVADGLLLNSAANTVTISVPEVPLDLEDVLLGPTYARFRFSSAEDLLPTGPAVDGEVEDYLVELQRSDSLWQNPSNNLDVNADGILSVLDALLIVSDLRNNTAQGGGSTHVLYPTPQQAAAHSPPQVFVLPRAIPFVDVDGNELVNINDILVIINGIRTQLTGSGEAESESLAGEGEAPLSESAAQTAADSPAPQLSPAAVIVAPRPTDTARREEENRSSLRSEHLGNELLLANSNFRTFEFEAALADIAGDVSGAWSDDEDQNELEDYFPYSDLIRG
jgi:hypothetical protein